MGFYTPPSFLPTGSSLEQPETHSGCSGIGSSLPGFWIRFRDKFHFITNPLESAGLCLNSLQNMVRIPDQPEIWNRFRRRFSLSSNVLEFTELCQNLLRNMVRIRDASEHNPKVLD